MSVKSRPRKRRRGAVAGVVGEFWSPRKLLLRAIRHERDHTAHIQKLKPR